MRLHSASRLDRRAGREFVLTSQGPGRQAVIGAPPRDGGTATRLRQALHDLAEVCWPFVRLIGEAPVQQIRQRRRQSLPMLLPGLRRLEEGKTTRPGEPVD